MKAHPFKTLPAETKRAAHLPLGEAEDRVPTVNVAKLPRSAS